MKKILFLFVMMVLFLSLPSVYAYANYTGTCGNNATWTLYDNGSLIISGSGEMKNYTDFNSSPSGQSPFYSLRDKIVSISIKEGITAIGSNSFNYCTNLKTIELPKSLCSI